MSPWRRELRAQARLALPIVVVQVGLMAMGVVDSLMVGRFGATDLAGVALGHFYTFFLTSFGMGVLMGLDPVVAQAFGARDDAAIAQGLQRGIVMSVLLSLPITVLIAFTEPVLRAFEQPADVIPVGTDYALVSILGVLPFLLFIVVRQTLQGMHRVRDIVVVTLAANVLNVLLNWALVFGHAGAPRLGAVGSAWATVLCRWAMFFALLATAWPALRPYLRPWLPGALARRPLGRMLHLGAPIGLQFMLEFGAFAAIGLLMGKLGSDELAGHQVTINLASLAFMVPLGISAAAAVRVGHGIGQGDPGAVRRAAVIALAGGAGFMCLSAAALLTWPEALARLYVPDQPSTLLVATALIPIAGAFQVFDGTQVVASGVLRGSGDTLWPMLVHITGFWVLGVPIAWWLTFERGHVPTGPWWGMVVALGAVALAMLLRVRHRFRQAIARTRIDQPGPHETRAPTVP